MTDEEIRVDLRELDLSDMEVTSFEADFIENVVYKYSGPLSEAQRHIAEKILEKYMA